MEENFRASAIADTILHLQARWASADKGILRRVFHLLAKGRPVPVTHIAEVVGCEPAVVDAALQHGRAERDSNGQVIELSGLMLLPTMHRIEIDGIALFGCCALMVHQVPIVIDRQMEVESVDPVSRRILRLVIDPDRVRASDSREALGSFVTTEARGVAGDVSANFRSHVRH